MRRQEVSLIRVILIYVAGLAAGIQCALFLYDYYDDRIADPLSGLIGIAFILLGVAMIGWTFRNLRR